MTWFVLIFYSGLLLLAAISSSQCCIFSHIPPCNVLTLIFRLFLLKSVLCVPLVLATLPFSHCCLASTEYFFLCVSVGSHTWRCSGFIPALVIRVVPRSPWGLGDWHLRCQESNLGFLHAEHVLSL